MNERYKPNLYMGLNNEQVSSRMKEKLFNKDVSVPTKSISRIFYDNIFTIFNFLNIALGIAIILVHSYKNLLFLGVAFCNTLISLFQEIRAKRVIDKLSVISSTKAHVIRNGIKLDIDIDQIVLDDIITYTLGNQVVVDSIIKEGLVEVDESFITGEANSIEKKPGDMLLSGSFIVSGSCVSQVEHVGADNYTNKISLEAKYIKKVNSEIMNTLNKFIKVISIVIIPLGILLFMQQMRIDDNTITDAVINTVAALIGMIPEGLILLTSTVLAVSTLRLANRKVLIQELYCIETLARVDTICIDKTGTITDASMEVVDIIPLDTKYDMNEILNAITTNSMDNNTTANALKNKFKSKSTWKATSIIPFSSSKKYSAMSFSGDTYIMGAPEIILNSKDVMKEVNKYSHEYRVILVAHSSNSVKDSLPDDITAVGLVLIVDKIRTKAIETIKYIKNQDVDIKIISGDNIKTILAIATKVGIENPKAIDLSTIDENTNLKDIVEEYNIFGRVTPPQKKSLILALKANNHTVAMIGDGVNDVLALKEADCSIALASGSDAARNVSQLILLNSNFSAIPKIVEEGRRSINNIERSATLFLTKTIYSTLLAILFLFINMNYPFQPIQLSLNSMVAIGIPSFILALEPNKERIRGKFIINIISNSIPAALTVLVNVISVMILSSLFSFEPEYTSTMAILLVAYTGFILLFKICYPFNKLRTLLLGTLIGIFVGSSIGLSNLFEMVLLTPKMFLFMGILCGLDMLLFSALTLFCDKKIFKYKDRITR